MTLGFAENLRRLRREKNMTQERLAEFIGVVPQSVSRWETGATYPDIKLLPLIADIFGVTVDMMLRSSEDEREGALRSEIISIVDTIKSGEYQKAADMIGAMRRSWPDATKMKASEEFWRIYFSSYHNGRYKNKALYDELIRLTEIIVSDCPNINTVGMAVDYMSQMADNEDYVLSHCTGCDISKLTLLRQRYEFRQEWDKYQPLQQRKTFDSVIELTNEYTFIDRTSDNPPEHMLKIYRADIEYIESLRNLLPPDADHGAVIDVWSAQLADLHLLAARESSRLGDTDKALDDIGQLTKIAEKALAVGSETDLTTNCSQLDSIVYHSKPQWMVWPEEETRFFYIYNYDLNWSFGIDPFVYTYQLKKEKSGFEPLYENERFISLYNRLEALKKTRPVSHSGDVMADD